MSAETERELRNLGWCVVELMGHRKLGAQVTEDFLFGVIMARCDVPGIGEAPGLTQFYGGAAIYCISPCSEEVARAVAARYAQPPVQRYELPAPRNHGVVEVDPPTSLDREPWNGFDDSEDAMPASGSPDAIED